MNIFIKSVAVISFLIMSLSISYYIFVSLTKQQAFDNCMQSYTNDWEKYIPDELRLSSVDFCERGYGFSVCVNIIRTARNETRAQYANPDNYWIQDKIKDETLNKIREKLGMPALVE